MKKILIMLLVMGILFSFTGCKEERLVSETEAYYVLKINGEYYLEFKKSAEIPGVDYYPAPFYVECASFEELKNKVLTGDFDGISSMHMSTIGSYSDPPRRRIFNLEKLYDVILPYNQIECTRESVYWENSDYGLKKVRSSETVTCTVFTEPDPGHEDAYYYAQIEHNEKLVDDKFAPYTDSERNISGVRWTGKSSDAGVLKYRFYYTIEGIHGTYYVEERFSDSQQICVTGKTEEGICFRVILSDFTQLPAAEYLGGFGLKEYKP